MGLPLMEAAQKVRLELKWHSSGVVQGRLVDEEHNDGVMFDVTIAVDTTETAQRQVLRALMRHLGWYIDLSHGGTR
jgi:hypothetical protein